MAKISSTARKRIKGIAIIIIFLSLGWAIFSAMEQKDSGPNLNEIFKKSNKTFEETNAIKKAKIRISSPNIANALQQMDAIVYSYAVDTPLLKSRESSYGEFIFKVDSYKMPELTQKLASLGNIEQQIEVADTSLVNKSLATEEEILKSKRKELADLEAAGNIYGSLADYKNRLITEIRVQEDRVKALRQSDITLLYVQLIPSVVSNQFSWAKTFALNFVKALVILVVGVVVLYYILRLIAYILSLFGVKGFTASTLGDSGHYGDYYNRYYSRYGYGGHRRKVKRIYKDGRTSDQSENKEETKDEPKT